ncbi:MAG: phospholipid methyltransferase [Burkholderiaceae bacterium]|nr:phospholipid methyltransferase [Burkholderiaceae bacterium]
MSASAGRVTSMHRAARANMARIWRAARHAVAQSPQSLFWRELAANPGQVGAICASSPRLAARMAAWVDPSAPGLVVELGGGTGVITAALLARGVPRERLVVVECSPVLAAHLARRFPGVQVLEGDAAHLGQWRRDGRLPRDASGQPQAIRAIVSGLPLLSIPHPARARIVQAGAAALAEGGRLIQFTYTLRGRSPWQAAGLTLRHSERVLANLPPARIDMLSH